MPRNDSFRQGSFSRRRFLRIGVSGISGAAGLSNLELRCVAVAEEKDKPTKFQIACMTLPYSQFPLERALFGIKSAGYRYVAWGTRHKELGDERVPVMPTDAPPERARQ